jgi:hypothetical protein
MILDINLILKKYIKEILEHIIIRKESFSLTAASSSFFNTFVCAINTTTLANKYLGAPKCHVHHFSTLLSLIVIIILIIIIIIIIIILMIIIIIIIR